MERSFQWLQRSLHSEPESTLFAIQDQVICTRVYQAKIIGSRVSVLCRLCGEQEETIQHDLAGCSVLAPTNYLSCHNLVTRVLHWHLCKLFDIPLRAKSWLCHQPLPVSENNKLKILLDFSMITDTTVACNRPDIVLFLKQEQHIVMLEISCPADVNIVEKEGAKVQRYQALAGKLTYLYEQPFNVISVVFGHLGVVSSH